MNYAIANINPMSILKKHSVLKEICLILGASIFIGLFAPLSVRLPFTPVPIALQSCAILFVAAFLGCKRGSLTVAAFLLEGLMGFPVFASGSVGLYAFFGPTGGYLIGYLAAAFIIGFVIDKCKPSSSGKVFLTIGVGSIVIYACGIAHLSVFVGFKAALLCGAYPFIPGDFLKLILTAQALKKFGHLQSKR